jgi:replication-associated recombination protein RarA
MSAIQSQSLLFAELAPDPLLNFPEPLSERYRPQLICEFAGLGEVKKVLQGFVTHPMNAGFLFVGPAGTGKTSMGLALEWSLDVEEDIQ